MLFGWTREEPWWARHLRGLIEDLIHRLDTDKDAREEEHHRKYQKRRILEVLRQSRTTVGYSVQSLADHLNIELTELTSLLMELQAAGLAWCSDNIELGDIWYRSPGKGKL